MTTETKRDLNADLALCEATTPGPWQYGKGEKSRRDPRPAVLMTFDYSDGDWYISADFADIDEARFAAESREGWPESIRRAIAAEAEVQRLDAKYQSMFSRALEVNKARDSYASAIHQAIYYLRDGRDREALTVLTEVSADATR
ncbi:hypothetical protein [Paenibacillus illinoisensis]|uniref:hypothetical protein n=1 Tax=Paenibacillus illinoisensis TaxID=59845 RepID=UPI00203B42CC|nr:hypothetical protein [Paenibacillus illinoisensis]MCM3205675.1 hypothetical protein [Paenibacillus illinoisensis]